ncbi:unnamed protein product [Boreogadus saida]
MCNVLWTGVMRMYNKTKIKTMRFGSSFSHPAARDRQAGCLPPFIGQSVAPAAEREEPNGPSSEAAPPPYNTENTYTTLGRNTLPLKTEAQHTYVASENKAAATKKLNNINVKGRKGKMLNGKG